MRTTLKISAAALALSLALPLGAAADQTMVKGEVKKVDVDAGKITILHGPIKKFDMDSMTMVFKAGDAAMLKQVKPGDRITFQLDKINGQFTVTKIEKTK